MNVKSAYVAARNLQPYDFAEIPRFGWCRVLEVAEDTITNVVKVVVDVPLGHCDEVIGPCLLGPIQSVRVERATR